MQAASFAWWASQIATRVDSLERRATDLEATDRRTADWMHAAMQSLSAIQANQVAARASLDRIERTIDGQRDNARPH